MSNKIILSADSTVDLGEELYNRYNVITVPLHVILEDNSYEDLVNITPDEIYKHFEKTGSLPKTSAVNSQEYIEKFKPYIDDGYDVIHINIGRGLSTSYNQCCMAAKELGHIYPVDSCNLSTASGLLVIEAAKRIEAGMNAEDIAKEVQALASKCHGSFVVDKLNYLKAGGRCSALAALGANLLNIKPRIDVDNKDGSMTVGKKYRGKFINVLETYVNEQLNMYDNIRNERVFITHSGVDDEVVNRVYEILNNKNYFKEIFITRASCTISSHCGPGTLGILFMTE
ncbi:MAG: DegV family protein [Ruminococcus sp.]